MAAVAALTMSATAANAQILAGGPSQVQSTSQFFGSVSVANGVTQLDRCSAVRQLAHRYFRTQPQSCSNERGGWASGTTHTGNPFRVQLSKQRMDWIATQLQNPTSNVDLTGLCGTQANEMWKFQQVTVAAPTYTPPAPVYQPPAQAYVAPAPVQQVAYQQPVQPEACRFCNLQPRTLSDGRVPVSRYSSDDRYESTTRFAGNVAVAAGTYFGLRSLRPQAPVATPAQPSPMTPVPGPVDPGTIPNPMPNPVPHVPMVPNPGGPVDPGTIINPSTVPAQPSTGPVNPGSF